MSGEPAGSHLRRARDEFASLLGQRTSEPVWQRFFSENPFVLSRGLPLKLLPCDILPLGRPGKSEPDFLLHPGSPKSATIHGLVELKTDYAKITSKTRKTEIILSRDAATAISQLDTYDALYDNFAPQRRILALETLSHLFVIMGSQSELNAIEDSLWPKLRKQLPPGVRFLTFDSLFEGYSETIPKPVALLLPAPIPPVPRAWAGDVQDVTISGLTLFRLMSHAFLQAGEMGQDAFVRHIDGLFSRPSVAGGRFAPLDSSVVYATDQPEGGIREMQRIRLAKLPAFRKRRFAQIAFGFSGRLFDILPGTPTESILQSSDLSAAADIAREAREAGFAALAFRSEDGAGRKFAIFKRNAIGKLIEVRAIDIS